MTGSVVGRSHYSDREGPIIDRVCASEGAARRGFGASMRSLADRHSFDESGAARDASWSGLIPDAFRVDESESRVVVWEVEFTSPVSPKKLARYASLWCMLDCEGWDLVLVCVGRYGLPVQVDLCACYYAILSGVEVLRTERFAFFTLPSARTCLPEHNGD